MSAEHLDYLYRESTSASVDIPPKSDSVVRIVHYNVGRWRNCQQVIDTIVELDADILCLNECLFSKYTVTKEEFEQLFGEQGFTQFVYANDVYGVNVICSKVPLKDPKIIYLGKDPDNGKSRFLTMVKVHRGIMLLHTQLDPNRHDDTSRLRQISVVLQKFLFYEQKGWKCVLLGDLNSLQEQDYTEQDWAYINMVDMQHHVYSPQTAVLREITLQGLIDRVQKAPDISLISCNRYRRHDYCITSNIPQLSLYPRACLLIKRLASDHYPLLCDVVA